jgi:hypothetical protein
LSVYELEVCVTHWTILAARREDPGALFGFKPCDEEGEHEIRMFVNVDSEGSDV